MPDLSPEEIFWGSSVDKELSIISIKFIFRLIILVMVSEAQILQFINVAV